MPSFVAALNCFIPGFGTILAACLSDPDKPINLKAVLVGVLQFNTAILVIGFFWSWWWSIRIIHKTDTYHRIALYTRKSVHEEIERRKTLTSEGKQQPEDSSLLGPY